MKKFIKVAVSERMPIDEETYITSHGWYFWNGNKFENENDEEIDYVNYWLEEVPDNEKSLRQQNKELLSLLNDVEKFFDKTPHLTELQKPMVLNKITELLNKVK